MHCLDRAMKLLHYIIFGVLLWTVTSVLPTEVMAQRYSRESSIGGVENVRFVAQRNGGIIEFSWEVRTTRDIVSIELKKGIPDRRDEVQWELMDTLEADKKSYTDFQPRSGKMFYKLVLIDKEGTAREYTPQFGLKDKS